ncbi:P-loop containing nucleoside triphosphate hydrolase protein [Sanghuangporus baumii]|uniref:RNA helicase n=1 Tax=Sanghuangporus baumii TaxID=108892 RepID=A0A9Q5NBB6_SANBA|nr:P-loop containing nucleoside triphosphate hydrolase protein [Sanghuangporus baumii]
MQFWKPGTQGPGSAIDRATELEDVIVPSAPSSSALGIQAARERLPIFKHRNEILYCVETYGVVIVHAQTGAGKTTQIPQYLYEAGWTARSSVIACTQPRRVAATSVAQRVATEMGSLLGDEVGYTIRFEDVSDRERTRIRYMTDGILFREALVDPLLSQYSVIMIDEAHERSIYTDLIIGILKKIRRKRPSLRLIISSATLDATRFLEYFKTSDKEATILSLEGRLYPVEAAYLQEPTPDYVLTAAEVAWRINLQKQSSGDILVFLAGREDIDRCLEELSELSATRPDGVPNLILLPLHAGLSASEQMEVFAPAERGSRKVIVATNIAEASITIDGIRFVIDGGFAKIRAYNPTTNLASLTTVPVSLASATQRAGRAGRTSLGICYRLYTEEAMKFLPATTPPEITRCDLTGPILQLKALGINDLMKFDWVTSPPAESVLRALENLVVNGVIDSNGALTDIGGKIAECPLEVNVARMLFSSQLHRCGEEILTISAMTAVQDVFIIPDGSAGALAELERRKFTAEEGDHLTLLNGEDILGQVSWYIILNLTSVQRFYEVWEVGRVVSITRAFFSCLVSSCVNPRTAEKVYAAIQSTIGGLKTFGNHHEDLSKFGSAADRRFLVTQPDFKIQACSYTMGAGQSKTGQDEQDGLDEVPVQFSQDVMSHLADAAASPSPTPQRQSSIDAQIRARIHSEVSRLQQEEEDIRKEIELSLAKENLDLEAKGAGHSDDDDGDGGLLEEDAHKALNSNVILGDLEEVRQKVEKYRSKREDVEQNPAEQAAKALSSCYESNANRPLECWKEAAAFKASVAQMEQDYIASFR